MVASRGLCDELFPYAWSPDGSLVLFPSCELVEPLARGKFACSLVIADDRGGQRTEVVRDAEVSSVSWAPDGTAVAFRGTVGDETAKRLYVVDVDTRRLTSVVDRGGGDFAWTPDGRWLMYVRDGGGASGLWRVTPDGARREKLLSRPGYTHVAVSPDGKYAAAVVGAAVGSQRGLDVIELQDGILVHRFPGAVSSPDWRPRRARSG